ncbi:glycosyltransferase family 2 protein [Pedobacter sp. N36a]|uniref:glycosyltransferase n=1 Tax=Pedobacter sp. N36a TaxID=2767996 RepID=UPI001656D809|nr:glycosyltransferase family 2 protein [Pedobacter sp. N36a]MBC8985439.1 glycosyltransferase family 2 protein [Pedobacter sp. N36a]
MNKGITVLVCTYNGASRLAKTIEHLASQKTRPTFQWELIVIDNASKDDSAAVAQTEWNKYNLPSVPFTVLSEQKPGKIYALEQGAARANYEYLLICDDDNWLQPDYLEKMYAILDSHPEVGAVGGQGIAVCDLPALPVWFKDYEEGYATGKQGPQTGDVTANGHLWGAGLGTRTSLYQKMYIGFPSLLTGRSGKQLTAGEDAEYCQRLILAGYKLYYDANLIFQHYMPENRLQSEYRVNLFQGFTESNKILHKYYLANALKLKSENNLLTKIRLLLVTPFRFLSARAPERKQKAKDTLIFLSPIEIGKNTVMLKIKKFYQAVRR